MEIDMTNKNEIAGVPALALRQFFSDCDEPFSVANLVSQLNLNSANTVAVLDSLILNGYVQVDEKRGLVKTTKAQLLTHRPALPTMTREEGCGVVLSVLKRVSEINASPETAHRVAGAKVIGKFLTDSADDVPFVEIEISIYPVASNVGGSQSGIEALAAEYAYARGEIQLVERNDRQRSIDYICKELLNVHPHAVLRFTVE